jgi:putative ABC transport system ATP-binding protein
MAYIQIKNLEKSYEKGRIRALCGVNLDISRGEFVAIMGPSGCGKSTLLNMIGALDIPDAGQLIINGKNLKELKNQSLLRAQTIGFVFQLHNLIPTLTALENVQIPMFEKKMKTKNRKVKAKEILELVGLKNRENSQPVKLSGGERQRVAVARALANDPEIIIADEPTGSLDSKSSEEILKLLKKIQTEANKTIIMVTHDQNVALHASRIIKMKDGKIV